VARAVGGGVRGVGVVERGVTELERGDQSRDRMRSHCGRSRQTLARVESMERRIVGFHQDIERHWVAELECGHAQHTRHDPPWQVRPWVLTAEGRADRLGSTLPCILCAARAPEALPRTAETPGAADAGSESPERLAPPGTSGHREASGMIRHLQVYDAPGITVTFDPAVCIHSGVCIRGLPNVFEIRRKRWVRPELAPAAHVAAQVASCPSGALQYRLESGENDAGEPAAGDR
jgi:uncharacterized Fe-S cluster protein YjdI